MSVFNITKSDGWVNVGTPDTIQSKTGLCEVRGSSAMPTVDGIELKRKEIYVPVYTGGESLWARALQDTIDVVLVVN